MYEELLVNVATDWVLFSFIESIIFSLLFHYIGNLRKMKWNEILVMGIGNAIISQVFPAVVFQFIIIIWMTVLTKLFNKRETFLKCFKTIVLSLTIFFVLEINYSIIAEKFLNIESLNLHLKFEEKISIFIVMIPIRMIEFLIIYIMKGKQKMKFGMGSGVKRK